MGSQFIVKRRTFEAAAPNPYRPKGQIRYGKWETVARVATFTEARVALSSIQGLYSTQIFYRGQKVIDKSGRVVVCVCGHSDTHGVNWREHRAHMGMSR